ncbi:MAG: Asp23/Gls24 family envelope stress response protein [Clostridia bacterium]|nr:Asp23/Gls24 family envelope stress response protein [Clostridia bacterium]
MSDKKKDAIEIEGEVKTDNNEEINKANVQEQQSNEQEGIQISNDVIAVIAGVAVSEVSGVASMAGGFAGGISEVLSGKKNMAKGIKVDKNDDKIKIDVNIVVEYGTRIPDVAFEIQNRVKKAVENMTGISVEEVNVHVQGVDTNVKKVEKPALDEAKDEN